MSDAGTCHARGGVFGLNLGGFFSIKFPNLSILCVKYDLVGWNKIGFAPVENERKCLYIVKVFFPRMCTQKAITGYTCSLLSSASETACLILPLSFNVTLKNIVSKDFFYII